MDPQFRLTKWSEWRVGDWYVWLKGSEALHPPAECVEVNQKEGYVKFRHKGGSEYQTFCWQGRYINQLHYAIYKKNVFGIGRCVNVTRFNIWIRGHIAWITHMAKKTRRKW